MQVIQDAVGYVQARPERFLRMEIPAPVELVMHIVSEALILGGSETCTLHRGHWWVITSTVDWLETHPDYTAEELFFHIVPFPEAGPNSMRAEILLTAFAHKVITVGPKGHVSVKGEVAPSEDIWQWLQACSAWKRAVAFCCE